MEYSHNCPKCKKPYQGFKNEISIEEYRISRLCQDCQDQLFGEDDVPTANAKCPNCGKLYHNNGEYGGVCSRKCADQYTAYLNSGRF